MYEESKVLDEEELLKKVEVYFYGGDELEAKILGVVVKGDKCTKFFHSIANSNRRYNSIDTLMIGDNHSSILEVEAGWLEVGFEEKVRKVVSNMNGDRALGPDGFSMAFFEACLDVLNVDIMKVFSTFHAGGMFEQSLNPGAIDLKDFRPISLVGGIYKIIAKVLALRSKVVLDKIISK